MLLLYQNLINYLQTSAGNAFMEYVRTAFIFRQYVGGYEAEIGKEINILLTKRYNNGAWEFVSLLLCLQKEIQFSGNT